MRFVEGLLGAAASLETSSENPAAWKCCMKAFTCANGTTSCLRCNLVETAGLDPTSKTEVNHTQLDQMQKPWLRRPQGDDQYDLASLSGSKFLNDLVQQGKWRKHTSL